MASKFKEISFSGEETKFIFVDEKDLSDLTRLLAQQILNSTDQIDSMIALGKGGWTVARQLIGYLMSFGLEDSYSFGIKQGNKIKRKTNAEPVIYQSLGEEVEKKLINKTVLVVDDLTDTGDQLKFVKEYLTDLGVAQIITATLFKKPSSTAELDHWAEMTSNWIIFAYEAMETMEELDEMWLGKGIDESAIRQRFTKIGFDEKDIEFYWQYLKELTHD
jgi:hypoxanthine phosphoribosyltransferase